MGCVGDDPYNDIVGVSIALCQVDRVAIVLPLLLERGKLLVIEQLAQSEQITAVLGNMTQGDRNPAVQ